MKPRKGEGFASYMKRLNASLDKRLAQLRKSKRHAIKSAKESRP